MSGESLPTSLRGNPRLSQWLDFRADGVVEVRSGKVEIGQGILTALAQIVAGELDVAPGRIGMIRGSTGKSPNEGVPSGSLSVQGLEKAVRYACAEARAFFIGAGAAQLGEPADALDVRDGEIVAASGKRSSYWELADAGLLERDATASVAPKGPGERGPIGENAPRLDLPDKVFGRPRYVHDLELPGMLHGRVLRPPSPAARLVALDDVRARAVAGVVAIVRDGRFAGVLAEREEGALKAVERLRADTAWEESETLPDAAKVAEWIRAQSVETTTIVEKPGVPVAAAATQRARFTRPFSAHASLGPASAVAQWNGDALHIWTHAQGVFNLRADLALAFALPAESILVEHVEGAGCYGHNAADDVALDAALLARAAAGRPVKVVWSREDEMSWAPFGPAMMVEIEADLDAAGEVVEWRSDIWSNGHSTRPGRARAPALLAGSHVEKGFPPPLAINAPLASGGGAERNAEPAYDFPARRVLNHRLLAMPIRTSALRSLGALMNVFAIEGFVDDLAIRRGEDPIAWRLRHLGDPRARAVVEAAARRSGWRARSKGEGIGRGIGYARYKNTAAYCAVVAEVEAAREIRVRKLWIAVDVGLAINPDGVVNQIEGGAIQAASWALKEGVAFDRTRVTSTSWESYPILRFSQVPAVEVEVMQQPEEPSVGAGEACIGPTAGALGHTVFDALGVRVRDLPITAERILAAAD